MNTLSVHCVGPWKRALGSQGPSAFAIPMYQPLSAHNICWCRGFSFLSYQSLILDWSPEHWTIALSPWGHFFLSLLLGYFSHPPRALFLLSKDPENTEVSLKSFTFSWARWPWLHTHTIQNWPMSQTEWHCTDPAWQSLECSCRVLLLRGLEPPSPPPPIQSQETAQRHLGSTHLSPLH